MTTRNDDARAERLKAALRENLRRRKVQGRGRAGPTDTPREPAADAAEPHEAAEVPPSDEG